jgi:hypothetical protein
MGHHHRITKKIKIVVNFLTNICHRNITKKHHHFWLFFFFEGGWGANFFHSYLWAIIIESPKDQQLFIIFLINTHDHKSQKISSFLFILGGFIFIHTHVP